MVSTTVVSVRGRRSFKSIKKSILRDLALMAASLMATSWGNAALGISSHLPSRNSSSAPTEGQRRETPSSRAEVGALERACESDVQKGIIRDAIQKNVEALFQEISNEGVRRAATQNDLERRVSSLLESIQSLRKTRPGTPDFSAALSALLKKREELDITPHAFLQIVSSPALALTATQKDIVLSGLTSKLFQPNPLVPQTVIATAQKRFAADIAAAPEKAEQAEVERLRTTLQTAWKDASPAALALLSGNGYLEFLPRISVLSPEVTGDEKRIEAMVAALQKLGAEKAKGAFFAMTAPLLTPSGQKAPPLCQSHSGRPLEKVNLLEKAVADGERAFLENLFPAASPIGEAIRKGPLGPLTDALRALQISSMNSDAFEEAVDRVTNILKEANSELEQSDVLEFLRKSLGLSKGDKRLAKIQNVLKEGLELNAGPSFFQLGKAASNPTPIRAQLRRLKEAAEKFDADDERSHHALKRAAREFSRVAEQQGTPIGKNVPYLTSDRFVMDPMAKRILRQELQARGAVQSLTPEQREAFDPTESSVFDFLRTGDPTKATWQGAARALRDKLVNKQVDAKLVEHLLKNGYFPPEQRQALAPVLATSSLVSHKPFTLKDKSLAELREEKGLLEFLTKAEALIPQLAGQQISPESLLQKGQLSEDEQKALRSVITTRQLTVPRLLQKLMGNDSDPIDRINEERRFLSHASATLGQKATPGVSDINRLARSLESLREMGDNQDKDEFKVEASQLWKKLEAKGVTKDQFLAFLTTDPRGHFQLGLNDAQKRWLNEIFEKNVHTATSEGKKDDSAAPPVQPKNSPAAPPVKTENSPPAPPAKTAEATGGNKPLPPAPPPATPPKTAERPGTLPAPPPKQAETKPPVQGPPSPTPKQTEETAPHSTGPGSLADLYDALVKKHPILEKIGKENFAKNWGSDLSEPAGSAKFMTALEALVRKVLPEPDRSGKRLLSAEDQKRLVELFQDPGFVEAVFKSEGTGGDRGKTAVALVRAFGSTVRQVSDQLKQPNLDNTTLFALQKRLEESLQSRPVQDYARWFGQDALTLARALEVNERKEGQNVVYRPNFTWQDMGDWVAGMPDENRLAVWEELASKQTLDNHEQWAKTALQSALKSRIQDIRDQLSRGLPSAQFNEQQQLLFRMEKALGLERRFVNGGSFPPRLPFSADELEVSRGFRKSIDDAWRQNGFFSQLDRTARVLPTGRGITIDANNVGAFQRQNPDTGALTQRLARYFDKRHFAGSGDFSHRALQIAASLTVPDPKEPGVRWLVWQPDPLFARFETDKSFQGPVKIKITGANDPATFERNLELALDALNGGAQPEGPGKNQGRIRRGRFSPVLPKEGVELTPTLQLAQQ